MNNIIDESLSKLKKNNILNPELDLRILLKHASYSKKDIILSNVNLIDIDIDYFNSLIVKRLNREPISKIIKNKNFWKSEFYVNSYVLDPRPESEIIIEEVLKNIDNKNKKLKILDIGTGSGCLAISLAKELINAKITGIDISNQAISVAKKNAKINKLNDRIDFKVLKLEDLKEKYDVIVSNPPYIDRESYQKLEKEVKKFEPKIALYGGKDGLKFYKLFAKKIENYMKKNSLFVCEIGHNQLIDCKKIFDNSNLIMKKVTKDIQKIDRTLTFFKI